MALFRADCAVALSVLWFGTWFTFYYQNTVLLMTYAFTNILRFGFFSVALALAFFVCTASASAAENPATAVFGPTIANVPWEYIPAWYKEELAAQGYAKPQSVQVKVSVVSTDPAVTITVKDVQVVRKYDPATAVFGPTIANVPWEYIPAWYKPVLLAQGYVPGPATDGMPAFPVRVSDATTPSTVTAAAASTGSAAMDTHRAAGAVTTPTAHAEETSTVGKETAGLGSGIDLASINADEWQKRMAEKRDALAEKSSSFLSKTSTFFLGVALIFLALIAFSMLKRRRDEGTLQS